MKVCFLFILIVVCSQSLAKSNIERKTCGKVESAMGNIVKNKNYTASAITNLFKQFKMSSKCDEGWYGELMTDIVVKATAQDFEAIVPKASSEKKMFAFIKRHINATADWDDLDKIVTKATNSCPKGFAKECDELKALSADAAKEAREMSKVKE